MEDPLEFKQLKMDCGQITYLGDFNNKNIILLIGRSNTQKNSAPLQVLIDQLLENDYTLIWLSSKPETTRQALSEHRKKYLAWFDQLLFGQGHHFRIITKQILKIHFFLRHPEQLDYFLCRFKLNNNPITFQTTAYRKLVQSLDDKSIVILSHSAGGRIASQLDDAPNIKKLICFGYPFKHPDKPEEPKRIEHLESIQKPFLIFQGKNDEYGGIDVPGKYKLSPLISISFVNAGHDYENIMDEEWIDITTKIETFIKEN
jgi:hypothetical protein